MKKFKTEIGGKELSVEIGKLAWQANGAVTIRYGDTILLVTCVISNKSREGVNYLPLMVNYEEKLYAAGKIKGSRFIKREGRATDEAVLSGRVIDRAIRPLFNSKIRNDIQIVATVLSFDGDNDPVLLGLIGASIALSISDIPWNGPVAAVSMGQINGKWVVNPDSEGDEKSPLNLVVAGTKDKINMIEGKAIEAPEKTIVEALGFAAEHIKKLIAFQESIIKEYQPKKLELEIPEFSPKLIKETEDFIDGKLEKALYKAEKTERMEELNKLKEDLGYFIEGKYENDEQKLQEVFDIFEEKINKMIHKNILDLPAGKEKRPDGRKLDEVRKISCEVGLLPRTHGSGLFTRGTTQALSIVTLGPPKAEQLLDEMKLEGTKRFMHHYNFPPFSVGEVAPMRGPGRREIGHGALAEKALYPLIPSKEEFPYTIRVVSEILSSNGSSSMASVCGSTLSLLDAGVPIKSNAAGIAMGLMMSNDGDKYKVLTDIQGPEDHHGDMDLKVAGTRKGITALQMDVKIDGLSLKILEDALIKAKKAREEILDKMEAVIKMPRSDLSPFAPRVLILQIDPEKIGSVIGPGGKIINKIVDETGAEIDIKDDGTIFVNSKQADGCEKAINWIKNITREVKSGEVFQGKVVKITDFGAFVEILPGKEGLLHISEFAPPGEKIKSIENIIHRGDVITVRIKNIDASKKISLALFKKGMRM